MTPAEMAKIYAPYAALKGFENYLRAMERETRERIMLGEDAAAELDQCLQQLSIGDRISVTYYLNDTYVEAVGTVCRIDLIERSLLIEPKAQIPFDDILFIQGAVEML